MSVSLRIRLSEARKLDAMGFRITDVMSAIRESHAILLATVQQMYDQDVVDHTECDESCHMYGCWLQHTADKLYRIHKTVDTAHVCHLMGIQWRPWLDAVIHKISEYPNMKWHDIRPLY